MRKDFKTYFSSRGMYLSTALILAAANFPSGSALANNSGKTNMEQQQTNASIVKGKVTDEKGEALIGVSVRVAGQASGVITDIDGNYTIKVPAGKQLIFSYVGYNALTVNPGGQPELNVQLKEDTQTLQDVVVVGYGVQKKASLTGAVASIDAKQLENKGTMTSPVQALQGTVPGVIITRGSGAPGDESWSMKLRGAVSTNNADPLVIVDGVEYSDGVNGLRLLNSDDIQSINFLKDASAAIYGSKAAGGVVLVTTKKGKAGRTTVSYNGSFTGKVIGLQPKLMTMDQWADTYTTAMQNNPEGGAYNEQWMGYINLMRAYKNHYIDMSNGASHPFDYKYFKDVDDFVFMDNDWQKILWGNSWSTQHELSISGGSEKNIFRISLGYMKDNSTLRWGNNNNQRYNLRVNDVFEIMPGMKLTTDIAYNRQDQVRPAQLGKALSDGNLAQPGFPAATIDGKPYAWGGQHAPNWYAEAGGDDNLKVSAINISETLNYDITKWLSATVNLGYNTSTANRDVMTKAIDWYNYAGTKLVNSDPNQTNSQYSTSFSRTDYYLASGYLNYHQTFASSHNLSVMAGAQYNYTQYKNSNASIKDINDKLEVPNGAGEKNVGGSKWHEAMMSYFGRVNYDYQGKYLVEGLARYDGSSKFQPENRWQFFWGATLGWRISEEAFMKSLKNVISNLKLRASYGVVGNQSGVDRYDGQQLYNFVTGGGVFLDGAKVSYINTNGKIASTDRTWERIHNYNIGLDFGFFENKLTGSVDIFWKKNNNMLIAAQYPGILGDAAPSANLGKFKANGWEGELNWSDKIGTVSYHVGGTFTYATNEVTDIGSTSVISAGGPKTMQGYPLNSYFGLLYIGKIQSQEELEKYTNHYKPNNGIGWTHDLRLGDNMFADVNKDGVLDQKDVVYLGSNDPKVSYSFNAGLEWNGFDVSAIFQGAADRTIFRTNGERIPFRSLYLNQYAYTIGKTWSPETPDAYYPAYTTQTDINNYNYQLSSWSVENGAYIRLKNITVGYTFPQKWIKKTGFITKLRIYFTGTDVWEHSKIRDGYDPEQATGMVTGLSRYPFNRTYTAGVNLTF